MPFQIHGLPATLFTDLFALSDAALAQRSASRFLVDEKPGFPCRISLADAEVGETVILVNYEHQPNDTPYRSNHAIFVRKGVEQAMLEPNEVPEALINRLLSVRAFDKAYHMLGADISDHLKLANTIARLFENPAAAYLHLHNAKRGCFAASVTWA